MPITFSDSDGTGAGGVQNSYPLRMEIGIEGDLADYSTPWVRSYRNQSGATIPFGSLVSIDNSPTTNDPNAVLTAINGTLVQGIAIRSNIFEGATEGTYQGRAGRYPGNAILADGRMGYPDGQTVSVLTRGVIRVLSATAIALGDPVRFFGVGHEGTLAQAFFGRWTKTAVANKTFLADAGLAWRSECAAGGIAELEIDFPNVVFSADT